MEPETKPKHAGGRPTKATVENVAKAMEYAEGGYAQLGQRIPTVQGLALHLNVDNELLLRSEFSAALARLKNEQAALIQNNALDGKWNPAFSKFLLSANHGMVEKTAVENSGEMGLTVKLVKYADTDTNDPV